MANVGAAVDDDDWDSAEVEMPPLVVEDAALQAVTSPSGAGAPLGGMPPPQFGGMPRPGGPPQQIDPKLVKKWNIIYP